MTSIFLLCDNCKKDKTKNMFKILPPIPRFHIGTPTTLYFRQHLRQKWYIYSYKNFVPKKKSWNGFSNEWTPIVHTFKFVRTNLPWAVIELRSLGPQAFMLPTEPTLLNTLNKEIQGKFVLTHSLPTGYSLPQKHPPLLPFVKIP